jgi:hypothetical protein
MDLDLQRNILAGDHLMGFWLGLVEALFKIMDL